MERLRNNQRECTRLQADRQRIASQQRAQHLADQEERQVRLEARRAALKAEGDKTLTEAWRVAREYRPEPTTQPPGQPRHTHCLARGCGSPLDPIYQLTGYHGICEPPGFRPAAPPRPDPQGALF